MPVIAGPSDIREEDFKPEERELVKKLSGSISPFLKDIFSLVSGGLDYSNLNRQIAENVVINIDSAGKVVNNPAIKLTVKGKVKGCYVVFAQNQTNTSVYPTNAPFISYTLKEGLLTILNVTGLQASSRYVLNVEIVAQS